MREMLAKAGRYLSYVSPIELFNAEAAGKLAREGGGFANAFKAGVAGGKGMRPGAKTIKDYFQGYNVGELAGEATDDLLGMRRVARAGAAAVAGTYFGSKLAFGENTISNAIGGTARLGTHAGIAYGLGKFAHPLAGLGYGGLAAANFFRLGNNIGPY
jgi:hypothetical protein